MKLRTRFFQLSTLTTFAALTMVAALSLSACAPSVGHPAANAAKSLPAAQVTVPQVIHRPLRDWSEFTGRLEPVQSVEIRPRGSGYIDPIGSDEADRVQQR